MRNLKTIYLLQESDSPNPELGIAAESVQDGDLSWAHEHLLRLMFTELSHLHNEQTPVTLLRFIGVSSPQSYEGVKEDLQQGRITLTNPFKFNDPMDPILKTWLKLHKEDAVRQNERKLFKMMTNSLKNLRISCFSDESSLGNNSPLMWSHYADSHRGIAIKYSITPEMIENHNDNNHLLRLCKVAYRHQKEMNDNITLDNALLAKSSCWEYEAECRLIYFTTNDNDLKIQNYDQNKRSDYISLDGFQIEAVYLGTRIDPKKEAEIKSISNCLGIPIFKMRFCMSDITQIEPSAL